MDRHRLWSSSARDAMGLPGDAGDRALTVNTLTAMAAAAAAAVLVMGFPVLINLTRHHGDAADVRGAIILAVTSPGPALVPLNSQGVLITRFVAARDHLARAVAVPVVQSPPSPWSVRVWRGDRAMAADLCVRCRLRTEWGRARRIHRRRRIARGTHRDGRRHNIGRPAPLVRGRLVVAPRPPCCC